MNTTTERPLDSTERRNLLEVAKHLEKLAAKAEAEHAFTRDPFTRRDAKVKRSRAAALRRLIEDGNANHGV